jgi:hypothetical protein
LKLKELLMNNPIVAVVGLDYVGLPETKVASYKNYCAPTNEVGSQFMIKQPSRQADTAYGDCYLPHAVIARRRGAYRCSNSALLCDCSPLHSLSLEAALK